MSMISSQCDKLRRTADEIERIKNNNTDWLWRDAVTLTDAVEQMREAADLILELRNNLQQANSENAKLRELVGVVYSDLVDVNLLMENNQLKAENAELRELVIGIWHELNAATQYDAGGGRGMVLEYLGRMCELGIEVDY